MVEKRKERKGEKSNSGRAFHGFLNTPWIRLEPDCMQIPKEISASLFLPLFDPTSLAQPRLSCRYLRCWLTFLSSRGRGPLRPIVHTARSFRTQVMPCVFFLFLFFSFPFLFFSFLFFSFRFCSVLFFSFPLSRYSFSLLFLFPRVRHAFSVDQPNRRYVRKKHGYSLFNGD